ncbi:ABA4-like family protein [Candidatus Pelagibacter sp.]|nr:ABA4-like family protein [Candidatus Pelagibacter sp.]
MIEEIYNYFTIEILYYWVNLGVLPFWLILIFFPSSNLSKYFITSIVPVFILSGTYIFILYKSYLNGYDFINNFTLYLSIDHLSNLFTDKSYLMMFWVHFIAINLFTGGWIVKDSQKFFINRILLAIPLTITYLIGPIGLLFYWLIRIFYAKNINLHD